jgi:hypothetical protein
MAKAKKNEIVEDNEINEKSKMDLEKINPNKKKSKKIDVVEKPKEEPKKDKKEKPKEKVIVEKMSEKQMIKELKNKEKELNKIKILANKINDLL